jgi:hypothetical protein
VLDMILGNKDKEMHITMVDLLARFSHMVSVAVLRDIRYTRGCPTCSCSFDD